MQQAQYCGELHVLHHIFLGGPFSLCSGRDLRTEEGGSFQWTWLSTFRIRPHLYFLIG